MVSAVNSPEEKRKNPAGLLEDDHIRKPVRKLTPSHASMSLSIFSGSCIPVSFDVFCSFVYFTLATLIILR